MSFDNHYPNRKDWRAPYRGSKRFDGSCRNHGGCPHCEASRQISKKRIDAQTKAALAEMKDRGMAQ